MFVVFGFFSGGAQMLLGGHKYPLARGTLAIVTTLIPMVKRCGGFRAEGAAMHHRILWLIVMY